MADRKRTVLRMPEKLHAAIEKRAKQHLRSVNSEMLVLLKLGLVSSQNEADSLRKADEFLGKTHAADGSKG